MTKTPRLGIEYSKFELLKNKNFQVPAIFVTKKYFKTILKDLYTSSLSFLTI